MDLLYLKTPLKLLFDKFVRAYTTQDFIEMHRTRLQINDTRDLMNEIEISRLKIQIPKMYEDSELL